MNKINFHDISITNEILGKGYISEVHLGYHKVT